ncbi:MAG: hypothetical protein ABIF09_04825 [Gemmatimonadota bacterium]
MEAEVETPDRDLVLYRLEVGGRIPASWAGWFEADTITMVGDLSVLDVRVADQAELYGRLRRIHDLNLRLISVTRIGTEDQAQARHNQ